MQRSSGHYLSFLVVALWLLASADINTLGVRGLHVGNTNNSRNNNSNNNNKNNQQRNVYYTSSSRSRCYSPRAVASPVQQQTGFNNKERSQHRAGLLVDVVVEHDDYLLHQAAPLLIPFDANKDAKTIKIISYSPTILLTTIDSLNDDYKQSIQAENSKKEKTEVPISSTIATASTTSTTSSGSTTTTSSSTATKVPPSAVMKLGCALAMNAGFLNGLGLSGILGRAGSVAAVTGTFTSSAVAFSSNPAALLTVLSAPLCYMLGSFTNGVLNPEGAPMDVMNLSWVQSSPLLLAGSLMVLLANTLSTTTTTSSVSRTFCLLTFALGLQNSFTSHLLSGNLLRTTHMSGMTSDIGSVIGQVVRGNTANAYKLPIFAKLTASFWAGGMLSVSGTKYILSTMSGGTTAAAAAASSAAGPIGCALSALLYFGLWTAWTEPLRRGISARISSPLLLCAKRLLYPQVVIASMRRGRHHRRHEDQHSYLSSSSSSSWGVLQ